MPYYYKDKEITNFLENDQYPDKGYWKDDIYHLRKKVIESVDSGVDFKFKTLIEQCPALNEDTNTIGTFRYFEGTHAKKKIDVNNYYMKLEVNNPEPKDQILTVIVNDLEISTFKIKSFTKKKFEFNLSLTKPELDLTFMNTDKPQIGGHIQLESLQLNKIVPTLAKVPRIFVASDSTAQTYTQKEYPQVGWGAALYKFLLPEGKALITEDSNTTYGTARVYQNGDKVIFNKSIGGRSSRSFIEEGKLASLASQLRRNDYLLIQWGDNDATSYRPMRYVAPNEFAQWLNQYIDCALGRGAHPILITPPSQCKFDGDKGHISFGKYRKVILDLAKQRNLPCIDLGLLSAQLLSRLGPKMAQALYMQFAPQQYPAFPDGIKDQTHFNFYGACQLARLVATEFVKIQSDYKMEQFKKTTIGELSAEIEPGEKVRLRWKKIPMADHYLVIKQNDGKDTEFTALNEQFLDISPGRNPRYKVIAYDLDINLASSEIEVPIIQVNNKTNIINGLNIYEVETDNKTESINFSLRFIANSNVKLYRVYTFNQRTREKWLLGKIKFNDVYKLHSYQVPSSGTWLVQVTGQDGVENKQISSKSKIIA